MNMNEWDLMNQRWIKYCMNTTFNVYVKKDKTIVYKKLKQPHGNSKMFVDNLSNKLKTEFEIYKSTITNKDNTNFSSIKAFDVENDGSYKSEYIDGYTLYELKDMELVIDTDIKKNKLLLEKKYIIESLEKFKINFNKEKNRAGDWHINNLMYCLKTKHIYNVDLEGFFTYKNGHNSSIDYDINIIISKLKNLN